MSYDDAQQTTDLFGSTDADQNEVSGDNNEQETLAQKNNQTEKAAKIQLEKNVNHWVQAIKDGSKVLADLPADKEFMRDLIQAKLPPSEDELERRLEAKFKKKEEDRAFQSLQKNLQSMRLTKAQQDTLQTEYDENKSLGLSDLKALEKAAKVSGISLDPEEQERMALRARMAVPISGGRQERDTNAKVTDPDFHERVTDPKVKMKLLREAMGR